MRTRIARPILFDSGRGGAVRDRGPGARRIGRLPARSVRRRAAHMQTVPAGRSAGASDSDCYFFSISFLTRSDVFI